MQARVTTQPETEPQVLMWPYLPAVRRPTPEYARPVPDSDPIATTRTYVMVEEHRRAAGPIGDSPNNNAANLWTRATRHGTNANPVHQNNPHKRSPSADLPHNRPNVRTRPNHPPPVLTAAEAPIDPARSQLTTTYDEDDPPAGPIARPDAPPLDRPSTPPDHIGELASFLIRCGIDLEDQHTREILRQHRINRWQHFILSNEAELTSLGITLGAARALCQEASNTM
ncbi:hypothetical protein PGTUg99_029177 [Puccinia graminis f. sp. tritici]|uniref:Uncharacterized protein n=1 Tax=Puccinia graminis f. sp. tritici TaxID=56615 RepID=A0A5B0RVK4_PUCGR|nr:hypothetical protein PGTUg99_029177 [Puccinia graminis f. sp. tritici]